MPAPPVARRLPALLVALLAALAIAAPAAQGRFGPVHTISSLGTGAVGALDGSGGLRALWAEPTPPRTRPIGFAVLDRRGRPTASGKLGPSGGRPYVVEPLPGGGSVTAREAGRGIAISVLSSSGRVKRRKIFAGGFAGTGEFTTSATVGRNVVIAWQRRAQHNDRAVFALVTPSGAVSLHPASSSGRSIDDCCSVTAAGDGFAVMWKDATDEIQCDDHVVDTQIMVRRFRASGEPAGPPTPVAPGCSGSRVNNALTLSGRPDGSMVAAWIANVRGTRFAPILREIHADDSLGRMVQLARATSGNIDARAVAVSRGRSLAVVARDPLITGVLVGRDGTISQQTVLSRHGNGAFTLGGHGDRVVTAWQYITRTPTDSSSSMYAAEWRGQRFARPQLIQRGRGLRWGCYDPHVTVNARGKAAVLFDIQSDRAPFELGARVAFANP